MNESNFDINRRRKIPKHKPDQLEILGYAFFVICFFVIVSGCGFFGWLIWAVLKHAGLI